MTEPTEITVSGVDYWADKSEQLAQLLSGSSASVILDPRGLPAVPDRIAVLTLPAVWAQSAGELQDALAFAAGEAGPSTGQPSRTASGAIVAVEDRLVFTVEEAAQLLGISRSFAYEAVQRGEIPSMRIGRRIIAPKLALHRFVESHTPHATQPESEHP